MNNTRMRILAGVSVLVLAALGCSLGQGSEPADPNVLFEDDFSTKSNDWDRVTEDGGSTDYANDGYRIFVNEAGFDYWANPGEYFEGDVEVTVDATKTAGPDLNDFGVICRYRQDEDTNVTSFYAFLIGSDGTAGIYKVDRDGTSFLNESGAMDVESSAIKTGNATNQIRAQCIGSTLTLYVNGQMVVSATDTSFTAGDVGLIAGTFEEVGVDILFDNFKVVKP